MADPLACKECAAWYREKRPELLADRQLSENWHIITTDAYRDVAKILEVDSPVMAYRARNAARTPFDKAAWMHARIADYHDNGHVPRDQRESVDDPDPT